MRMFAIFFILAADLRSFFDFDGVGGGVTAMQDPPDDGNNIIIPPPR